MGSTTYFCVELEDGGVSLTITLLLVSVILTLLVTFFLSRRYKISIKKNMQIISKESQLVSISAPLVNSNSCQNLLFKNIGYKNIAINRAYLSKALSEKRLKLALSYLLPGLLFGMIFGYLDTMSLDLDMSLKGFLVSTIVYSLPGIYIFSKIYHDDDIKRVLFFGLILLIIFPFFKNCKELLIYVFICFGMPFLVFKILTIQNLKSSIPVLITGVYIIVLSLNIAVISWYCWVTPLMSNGVLLIISLLLVVVVFLSVFGFLAFWLQRLSFIKIYINKWTSNQMITFNLLWFLFANRIVADIQIRTSSNSMWFPIWMALVTLVIGYFIYAIVTKIIMRLLISNQKNEGHSLLLLRVFNNDSKTNRLFNYLSSNWRYIGPINMIGGPDLATLSIKPHRFQQFLIGKLSNEFVKESSEIDQKIEFLDIEPDLDGRYRVNEFFCSNSTWKPFLQKLSPQNALVLMDLRNFSLRNKGCIFEMEHLLNDVDLSRVLFLIDSKTNIEQLKTKFRDIWQNNVEEHSPNLNTKEPIVRFVKVSKNNVKNFKEILMQLQLIVENMVTQKA